MVFLHYLYGTVDSWTVFSRSLARGEEGISVSKRAAGLGLASWDGIWKFQESQQPAEKYFRPAVVFPDLGALLFRWFFHPYWQWPGVGKEDCILWREVENCRIVFALFLGITLLSSIRCALLPAHSHPVRLSTDYYREVFSFFVNRGYCDRTVGIIRSSDN